MLIDSHVNLHAEAFAEDREAVIARAREADVAGMITICDRLDAFHAVRALAAPGSAIWASAGVHPHHAKDFADLTPEDLIARAGEDDRVVAIGECGLDRHYAYSEIEVQKRVFDVHAEAAKALGSPLVIHSRDADDDMIAALDRHGRDGRLVPLLHCYTGGPELLDTALAMGGYVAFSGILAFKNAGAVRDMAARAPMDRILIETDCPYLSPPPHRGRRNEPAYLPHVAEALARVKEVSAADVAAATTDAFFRLFTRCDRSEAERVADRAAA